MADFLHLDASDMTRPKLKIGAEPHLAKGFKVLSKRAESDELRTFCKEGVTYTLRRVDRIKKAPRKLDAPLEPGRSSGLDGLIRDAKRAAARTKSAESETKRIRSQEGFYRAEEIGTTYDTAVASVKLANGGRPLVSNPVCMTTAPMILP